MLTIKMAQVGRDGWLDGFTGGYWCFHRSIDLRVVKWLKPFLTTCFKQKYKKIVCGKKHPLCISDR